MCRLIEGISNFLAIAVIDWGEVAITKDVLKKTYFLVNAEVRKLSY